MIALIAGKTGLLSMLQLGPLAAWQDTGPKNWRIVLLLSLILSLSSAYADGQERHTHEQNSIGGSEESHLTNTVCPVMIGNKVNSQVFLDYKGKRVYFCCLSCKFAFEKNPDKYLPRLPQFGQVSEAAAHDHHDHSAQPALSRLVKPMGIATLTVLVLTVLAGLMRRKKPKFLLKWHKRLAVTTLVLAIVHVTLVLITH